MEIKKSKDLSIRECLDRLDLKESVVKNIVNTKSDQAEILSSIKNLLPEASKAETVVMNRLAELLTRDKLAFFTCKKKEDLLSYLSEWEDGLWRNEANMSVKKMEELEKRLNSERKDDAFFEQNKDSIKGLKTYLAKYPTGQNAYKANNLLNQKLKKRRHNRIGILIGILLGLAVASYFNYHPASYLNAIDRIDFNKYGGTVNCLVSADPVEVNGTFISTNAKEENLSFQTTEGWVKVNNNDAKQITIEVGRNPGAELDAAVNVYASTTLWGVVLNKKATTIKIHQESGLATKFSVKTDSLELTEGKPINIAVTTDGTTWSVESKPSWLDTEVKVAEGLLTVTPKKGNTSSGEIKLSSNNGHKKKIHVKLWGDPTNFEASSTTIRFGTSYNSKDIIISNDSRKSLSASTNYSWITPVVKSNTSIKISCDSNDDPHRSGIVHVSCGNKSLDIDVKQDGWKDCADCVGGTTECEKCKGKGKMECDNYNYSYGKIWHRGDYVHGYKMYTNPAYGYEGEDLYGYYWIITCNRCKGDYYITCKTCGGSKKTRCRTCGGRGKVIDSAG